MTSDTKLAIANLGCCAIIGVGTIWVAIENNRTQHQVGQVQREVVQLAREVNAPKLVITAAQSVRKGIISFGPPPSASPQPARALTDEELERLFKPVLEQLWTRTIHVQNVAGSEARQVRLDIKVSLPLESVRVRFPHHEADVQRPDPTTASIRIDALPVDDAAVVELTVKPDEQPVRLRERVGPGWIIDPSLVSKLLQLDAVAVCSTCIGRATLAAQP